jgi:WD40 repeat protein
MRWESLVLVAAAACASSSHDSPTAAPDIATPSCAAASAKRAEGERLLAGGRLVGGVAALGLAREQCPAAMGDAWGDLVDGLVDLGRYEEARRERGVIDSSSDATPVARRRAAVAVARGAALDRSFAEGLAAKEPMLQLLDRGLAALEAGRAADAKALFLQAWEQWRPNGQALAWAGSAAQQLGDGVGARRLYDRAWVELEREMGDRARAHITTSDEDADAMWVSLEWSQDSRWLTVSKATVHLGVFAAATGEQMLALNGYFARSAEHPWLAWVPWGDSSDILVLHVPSGHVVARLPGSSGSGSAARPRQLWLFGERLFVVDDDGVARLFDVPGARELARVQLPRLASVTVAGGLIVADDRIMGRDDDREVLHAFEAGTLRPRWTYESSTPIDEVSVSPDGATVAIAINHAAVALLDAVGGRERARLPGTEGATRIEWSRDGKRLLIWGARRDQPRSWASLWDAATGTKTAGTELDGRWVGWADLDDGAAAVWTIAANGVVDEPRVLGRSSVAVDTLHRLAERAARSPDGRSWASLVDANRTLRIEQSGVVHAHSRIDALDVRGICSAGRGELVVAHGGGITVWNPANGEPKATPLAGAPHGLRRVACSGDGRQVAAWDDTSIYVADGSTPLRRLAAAPVFRAAWSPDGKVLVGLAEDSLVAWDVAGGVELLRASADKPSVPVALRDSMFATYFFTALGPSILVLPVPFPELSDVGEAVAASADGRRIAVGPGLRVFDAASAQLLMTVDPRAFDPEADGRAREEDDDGGPEPVGATALSAGGTLVAARRIGLPWKLWRVGQQKSLGELDTGLTDDVLTFPSEDMFAVVSDPGPVRIWTTLAGAQAGELHLLGPTSAAIVAPNGDVELLGAEARTRVHCRVGPVVLPFEVCAERIETTAVLERGPAQ